MILKLFDFFKYRLWEIPTSELGFWYAFLIKKLRVIALAVKNFLDDNCQLRASALTFYILLSIVPLAAMLFGVAKGFGMDKVLEARLYEKMAGQEEVVSKVVEFAKAMLAQTQGGLVAGIGILILFWTTIKLLGNIEAAFNHIWGVKKARTLARKISDYLSLLLICPILIISSGSLTVLVTGKLHETLDYLISVIPALRHFDFLVFLTIKIIPYIVVWILFTFIYIFVPNTKVKFQSAFIAGIIAGTAFQILQWLFLNFQIYLSNYNAIYGSFSALPLFLLWLQISWLIILFGAQIAFAVQNIDLYEFDPSCKNVSLRVKRVMSLSIVQLIVSAFKKSEQLSAEAISQKLNIPIRLINQLLHELNTADVISEVHSEKEEITFQPAIPVSSLNIGKVLTMLDISGNDQLSFSPKSPYSEMGEDYQQLFSEIDKSEYNFPLDRL